MEDKKFCKVTFYADLTNEDKRFLLNDFAQTMTEAAQIDSVCGVSVTDPNNDHAEELLNSLIDYVSLGRSVKETIQRLLLCGFEKSDLIAYGFKADEIPDEEDGEVEDC